jgi:ACS family tartrate transporter-like MFS transporter
MSDAPAALTTKIRTRILLPIVVLIVLSSLDRVNISFAALQMNAELGLAPESYGFAVGLFFVGYLLFQFPSTWILTRVGARRWIAASVMLWGCVAAAMGFVQSASHLYALRFLLGCVESGFAPGVVYYCGGWLPARYRANTIAITMLAVPISVIVGGPLCGWLMHAHNPFGLPGWRWMLFIEGGATVLAGTIAYFLFVDTPSRAFWLSPTERDWIEDQLQREDSPPMRNADRSAFATVAMDRRTWLAAAVWCTTLIGANGLIFWLPQVIKEMSSLGDLAIGVLSALPWIGVGIGMVVNSWLSDRTQERYRHVGFALVLGTVAIVAASMIAHGVLALMMLVIGGVGLGAAQGVFWSIPTTFLPRAVAAAGITLINLIGNVGGLVGPYLIGLIRTHSGSFAGPVWFVAAVMASGAIFISLLQVSERRFSRGQ